MTAVVTKKRYWQPPRRDQRLLWASSRGRASGVGDLPFCCFVSAGPVGSGDGWTESRRRLHAWLAERSWLLAEYYASAIYFLLTQEAPARMSHLAHAVRELLSSPARCRGGCVKLDRRQSEARSEEFIKAWEAVRLPDDAGGFRVCGEVVT
jgi:hypothetical protein